MKKALALVMAIAMVASMAAVSFAAKEIDAANSGNSGLVQINDSGLYKYSKSTGWTLNNEANVAFGKTVYVVLADAAGNPIKDGDAVSGVKLSVKWEEGKEYVKSTEIVKVDGQYVIAIATTGSEMSAKDVAGTIALGGKTIKKTVDANNDVKETKVKVDIEFDVDFKVGYPAAADLTVVADGTKAIYDYEGIDDDEYTILVGNDITVETYMKNTKKVLFSYNDDENEELLDAYVDANLDFYNCAMTFRRSATVTLVAEEGSYLYEVVDGQLVEMDAEYDEWEEAFVFTTRKLGNYVVSDVELEVAEEVVATNPSTGAAA